MRLPVALDDLVVPAPGQILATVLCDEGRRLLPVFLIGGRIVDIDVDDHVGGHGSSPMFAGASLCSALDYMAQMRKQAAQKIKLTYSRARSKSQIVAVHTAITPETGTFATRVLSTDTSSELGHFRHRPFVGSRSEAD